MGKSFKSSMENPASYKGWQKTAVSSTNGLIQNKPWDDYIFSSQT
jgi:hypothetical protein